MPPYVSPHLDQLGALLLQIESDTHRGGWDQDCHVRLIYDNTMLRLDQMARGLHESGPRWPYTRKGNLSAITLVPVGMLDGGPIPPWEAWRTFALNLAYATDDANCQQMLRILQEPGVCALAIVHEAWFTADAAARRAAISSGGKVSLGDIPGTLEARSVYACDVTRTFHRVGRLRGAKPELISPMPEDTVAGDFSTSLKIIMDAVAGTVVPPDILTEVYPTLARRLDHGL